MEEVKLYFDFKSPFAFLARDPAFNLEANYDIVLRWIPFQLRLKGKGERSIYSEYKARYSYLDARRWANRRGGFPIKGPLKVYDSRPSLIAGLYALREGFFPELSQEVWSRFFDRRLEIDRPGDMAALLDGMGRSGAAYLDYFEGAGAVEFEACQQEASEDHIFGVPIFLFRGEPFWGHDRIPLLEERLGEAGLAKPGTPHLEPGEAGHGADAGSKVP